MPDHPNGLAVALSICVPVYNEASSLAGVLDRLLSLDLPFGYEVIAVDDGSTDGSRQILESGKLESRKGGTDLEYESLGREVSFLKPQASSLRPRTSSHLRVCFHDRNLGKSAALSTAIAAASGRVIAIQDADLEYDPCDFASLVAPILEGRSEAVFGSRYLPRSRNRGTSRLHTFANRFLTTLSNFFTGLRLTDMETCRKIFLKDRIGPMPFRARRFAVEPEICWRLSRSRTRILEYPISYDPRNRAAGKKIGWRDALEAINWIARCASGLHSC